MGSNNRAVRCEQCGEVVLEVGMRQHCLENHPLEPFFLGIEVAGYMVKPERSEGLAPDRVARALAEARAKNKGKNLQVVVTRYRDGVMSEVMILL